MTGTLNKKQTSKARKSIYDLDGKSAFLVTVWHQFAAEPDGASDLQERFLHEPHHGKTGLQNFRPCDTNWTVQSQKNARRLKFWV